MKIFSLLIVGLITATSTAIAEKSVWRIGHRSDRAATVAPIGREVDARVRINGTVVAKSGSIVNGAPATPGVKFKMIEEKNGATFLSVDINTDELETPPETEGSPEDDTGATPPPEEDPEEVAPPPPVRGRRPVVDRPASVINRGYTSIAMKDVINNNYGNNFFLPGGGGMQEVILHEEVTTITPATRGFGAVGLR